MNEVIIVESILDLREQRVAEDDHQESTEQLKYGPVGLGDRRTTPMGKNSGKIANMKTKIRHEDTDDELDSSSDEDSTRKNTKKILDSSPQVAYTPLELDSDVESDLSSIGPRSRRRVPSGIFDDFPKNSDTSVPHKRPFPNPDHYEDPRSSRKPFSINKIDQRNGKSLENLETQNRGGFSRTNSFEFSVKDNKTNALKSHAGGDFNEVGIPVMEPLVVASMLTTGRTENSHQEAQVLMPMHQKHASQGRLETIRSLLDSVEERRRHRLDNEILSEEESRPYPQIPPPIIGRPPSRGQASSGFGSLPEVFEKNDPVSSLSNRQTDNVNTKENPEVLKSSRKSSPEIPPRPKGSPLSTAL